MPMKSINPNTNEGVSHPITNMKEFWEQELRNQVIFVISPLMVLRVFCSKITQVYYYYNLDLLQDMSIDDLQ